MMRSRFAALAAFMMALAGCGGDSPEPGASSAATTPENIVFRKGNQSEPQSLDPHRAEGVPSSHILRDLFEGLTSEAPDGSVIPGGAESWEISPDGRVYTFKLRADSKWSNGEAVAAADFAFGLRRSVDPATLSEYSQILAPVLNAEDVIAGRKAPETLGVEALDALTLKITLRAPTPYFLGLLNHSSTYPVHQATVEQHGSDWSRPGTHVSNGAYRLGEWIVNSHVRLDRNPHYRDDAQTQIDTVFYYSITDQSTELKRYRAGELDWTYELPNKQIDWVRKNLTDELHISPYLGTYFFGFNVTRPPFKENPALRKALSLAIDRDRITQRISGAGEIPAYAWVPAVPNYTPQAPEWANWTQAERVAEAQRLYAEAGYSADRPLQVSIMYNTQENHKNIAVEIASSWQRNLGVNATLANQEWKVFLQTRKDKRETEVFRQGWIGDYADAYNFAEILHSQHGINDTGYANPDYDALLASAGLESDPDKRRALLEEAERLVLADLPIMPVYFYVTKRVVKPYVEGYVPNIMDHHYTKNFRILRQ